MHVDLGDPGGELEQEPFDPAAGAPGGHDEVVGEHDALLGGEAAEREADHALGRCSPPSRSGRPKSTASSR